MINFIRKLLGLCVHEWCRIGISYLDDKEHFEAYRCTKCGNTKKVRV